MTFRSASGSTMSSDQLAFADPQRGAVVSACGRFRYSLWRRWGAGTTCVFVMLNPSTADAERDDPTIRRCVNSARAWGHGQLVVVNLFAWRATNPDELRAAATRLAGGPVGPHNDAAIREAVERADLVVAAWGTKGTLLARDRAVTDLVLAARPVLHCLRATAEGHPEHPLYLPAALEPVVFAERRAAAGGDRG